MSFTLDQLIENGGGYVHQDTLEQVRDEVEAELVSARVSHCQCPACSGGVIHKSDCAVHNMPYKPNGNCDCMAEDYEALWTSYVESRNRIAELTTLTSRVDELVAADRAFNCSYGDNYVFCSAAATRRRVALEAFE